MLTQLRASRCLPALLLLFLGSGASALTFQEKPADDGPMRVGEGVSRPEKISGAPPVYTEEARRARITGQVIVGTIIDEQGNVMNPKVLQGLPKGLSESAVEAVKTWKFKPAMYQGKPVKVYYTLTVNFAIESTPSFGPAFQDFLSKNQAFASHFGSKRYQEAAAVLDRMRAERPEDSAVTVARIYLLLAQDQLDEAWKLALAFRGPDSYEVLDRVGTVALDRVVQNPLLNPDTRGKIIETGLMAETMAMEADPHRYEAPLNKSVLLLQKSKLTSDPAERQALLAEMRQMIQVYARIRNIPVPGEGRPPQ